MKLKLANVVRLLLLVVLTAPLGIHFVTEHVNAGWQTASRESVGLAPKPEQTPEAIIQVYGARAYGWRGYFGIHTWIAVKPSLARTYTVYEVIGWYLRRGGSAVSIHQQQPDRRWFGNMPILLAEKRGEGVDALIDRIEEAALSYPYAREYTMWPGPNSNTFTAWIARAVPELALDLPPTAIGKDYLGSSMTAVAPSGGGWQWSLFGLLGVIVSEVEGFEINLLGLTFGFSHSPVAIKLPLIGRIALNEQERLTASAQQ
ncbi:DUF3750 domain-containing protein [Nitrosomonas communis]|uniref:DUF3750 domain-containing protein n=1 Tax=Nitrosomonas communis TaxID=44574 RepID=A0A1H2VQV1_9PROT|nr:DUF3750 domain-containing protein [Nitrosomonas communis]SDW70648.1 Protein of unknown function [Nitrosomonas communis]